MKTCHGLVSKPARQPRILVVMLTLAFAVQMTAFASTTSAHPLPSQVSAPAMDFTKIKGTAPLVLRSQSPRKQSLIKRNHRSSESTLAQKGASRNSLKLSARSVKSRKRVAPDCQGCKDDCLTFSLECIGLSMLGGCGPCAAICLAEQVRCQLKCPCAAVVVSDN